jgi:hypothetical protein
MRLVLALAVLAAACGSNPPATSPSNRAPATGGTRSPEVAPSPDPYKAKTWIAQLDDPGESERAVTELEVLGDPAAITALGQAWTAQGKPVRVLVAMISLARPLTPAEAKAGFVTDYETSGRPASWDLALPFLIRALTEIDGSNPRSVDSALKAANALGDAKLPAALDALSELATRPFTKKLIAAQVAAIRALGRFSDEPARAAVALLKILDRDPPPHPTTARDHEQAPALEEGYALFLGSSGAAINALGELRGPGAAKSLVLALYRTPELFLQTRRALVASGPAAKTELRKVLRGESTEVNQLFKDKRLDTYCGDKRDAPPDRCQPVSAKDFYPAVVLGDFYDPATVPDLLAVLARPAAPVYFLDDQPSPSTQYNAVFDALRKIGAPEAAGPIGAMWMRGTGKPLELATRILAIAAYPFVTRDATGAAELGKIAADTHADDALRLEAASALARVSSDGKDIAVFQGLAQTYLDASARKAREAAGKQKAAAKNLDRAARVYQGYARMFQTNIARIEIAARCKLDLPCYAASLTQKPDDAAAANARYIKDLAAWTDDEKRDLVAAAIERAMLEIGKQGAKASQLTDALLDAVSSDVRLIRQSVLLALPKIAPLPCARCEAKLAAVIHAGEGKPMLGDLNAETMVLRNYFSWAGGSVAGEPARK